MDLVAAAAPPRERASAILDRLANEGRRMTGPRQAIVRYVAPRTDTFSAQDIVDQLHGRGMTVGRATVFRTLEMLAELGLLHRIHNDDGFRLYTVCADDHHHHHLRCIVCGAVQALSAPGVEVEIDRLARQAGFEVVDHVLELVGRCRECRRDAAIAPPVGA